MAPGSVHEEKSMSYEKGIARSLSVFASYSHKDEKIVELVESCWKSAGEKYLRDRNCLRSGDHWQEKLYEHIESADIFQLFWSPNAAVTEYVKREWQHALKIAEAGKRNLLGELTGTGVSLTPNSNCHWSWKSITLRP